MTSPRDNRKPHGWRPLAKSVRKPIPDGDSTIETLQAKFLGIASIWDHGLHGEGQIIGVIDSGMVDLDHCWFRDPSNNAPNPEHRKVLAVRNASGSGVSSHGTFVCGIAAGDDIDAPGAEPHRGIAWAARITFGNSIDVRRGSSMLSYLVAAAGDGARIHTNSWHEEPQSGPQYNQTAADVDGFVWNNEDNLVLGSSGNAGDCMGPPGTAKNALCVSAARTCPDEITFGDGAIGPTSDIRPRWKPDLLAPGCLITSARSGTSRLKIKRSICASSWATSAAAGAAALVRQYYLDGYYPTGVRNPRYSFVPSGALIKATLLNSTVGMTGSRKYAIAQKGWGLIRLDRVLRLRGSRTSMSVWDFRHAQGLRAGEVHTHVVEVPKGAKALKITLVWSDPPAVAGSADPVVNNLDLIVTGARDQRDFRGNAFDGDWESVGGGKSDDVNNVEMVMVHDPGPGEWRVAVVGRTVKLGNPGQGYALVASLERSARPEQC